MFNGDYSNNFKHVGQALNMTSKVIARIIDSGDKQSILPCFLD